MKTLFEHAIGGDGIKGGLYIEGDQLKISASAPLALVVDPVMDIVENLIDKLEALIPGDQKALSVALKDDARAQLMKMLSEPVEAPAKVEAPIV